MIDRRRFAAGVLAAAFGAPAARAGGDPFALAGTFEQGGIARGQLPSGATALRFNDTAIPFAADRRFLIAFDRDAPPTATVEAVLGDGRIVRDPLVIAPRAWNISRLDRLAKYPVPSAEFEARRPAELARIAAARARQTAADGWRQPFAWPATGRISTLFGSQRIYAGEPGAYHSGIDIALPTGTPVRAPADGVVILAAEAPFTLEGNLLMLDHGMGLSSAFLHLSRIDVREGDAVRQGQAIGAVGATGRATGPHLHWGLMWRGARIDPLLVAGAMPAR
ncbi:M23 family metallopeptidase [Sphingomonas azotifigens]|uniref:M23 family metallopeptidase n=1 Tax=Sphingomonas azotifigens TaxID=330920 RepID=UPI000A00D05E|nr:M23 family metallopeptidase [Sphingomonas azotifigens]